VNDFEFVSSTVLGKIEEDELTKAIITFINQKGFEKYCEIAENEIEYPSSQSFSSSATTTTGSATSGSSGNITLASGITTYLSSLVINDDNNSNLFEFGRENGFVLNGENKKRYYRADNISMKMFFELSVNWSFNNELIEFKMTKKIVINRISEVIRNPLERILYSV